MPLYEYECGACGHRLEIIQKFSDSPPEACPKCGKGPLHRLQSSPAFQFKGTGWYVTDYAGKGKSGGESSDKSDKDTKPGAKSDSSSGTSESGGESKKSEGESKKSEGESKKSDAPASTPAAKE